MNACVIVNAVRRSEKVELTFWLPRNSIAADLGIRAEYIDCLCWALIVASFSAFTCFCIAEGRSSHPQLSDGGAFQVSLSQLKLDFYPYHLAAGNRSAWICYQESVHATWLSNSVMAFESDLLEAVANDKKSHSPLARQAAKTTQVSVGDGLQDASYVV